MPKPFASARISEALNAAIDKRCEETGEKRSAIITNALEAYLEADAEAPLNLEQQVKAHEKRIAYLEEHLNQPIQATLFDNKTDNISDDKTEVIKTDNQTRLQWTTKQIEEAGIGRKAAEYRAKADKFPLSKNGVTIHKRIGKEVRNGRST